jgi:hypothetical protein
MKQYTIEVHDDYVLFLNPIPVNDFLAISKAFKKKFKKPVFDYEIARRLNVSFCLISQEKAQEIRKLR